MEDKEIPGLQRRGYNLHTVSYLNEAVDIWIGRWTWLARKYGHCVQGEDTLGLTEARRTLVAPTEEKWVPLRAVFWNDVDNSPGADAHQQPLRRVPGSRTGCGG